MAAAVGVAAKAAAAAAVEAAAAMAAASRPCHTRRRKRPRLPHAHAARPAAESGRSDSRRHSHRGPRKVTVTRSRRASCPLPRVRHWLVTRGGTSPVARAIAIAA